MLTPCFNEEARLPAYIKSLANQTVRTELMAIDDGSSDKTLEVLNQSNILYSAKNERNLGIARTFNKLLDVARTYNPDYLTWSGVDEDLYPDAIERRLVHLQNTGASIMFSGADAQARHGKILYPEVLPQFTRIRQVDFSRLYQELLCGNFLQSPILINARKTNIEDLYIDPKTKHFVDWDQYLRLSKKYPVSFLDASTGCSDWDGGNFSRSNPLVFGEKMREMTYILDKHLENRSQVLFKSACYIKEILKVYVRRLANAAKR